MLILVGQDYRVEAGPPPFKVTLRRPDDSSSITYTGDRAILAVRSPFGISQATIKRQTDHWPKAVVVRLHLRGLEYLQIKNGKRSLHAVVGIRDKQPEVRLWKDQDEEHPLTRTDPFWMTIHIRKNDGSPAHQLPLQDGYFEVELPGVLLADNPRAITLHWIDFYR
jgi:hypothetical protein